MDSTILHLVLAVLAFALAGNVWLSLAVLRASRRERVAPVALEAGQALPQVTARLLGARQRVKPGADGQPAVLLFLASRCPKCLEKLAALDRLLPQAHGAGLALWLVSEEPARRLRRFLGSAALQAVTARVSLRDYRLLNPQMSSPSYVFVDHQGAVQAAGLIGDENWLGLLEQLADQPEQKERAA